jgi:hypothetical protein
LLNLLNLPNLRFLLCHWGLLLIHNDLLRSRNLLQDQVGYNIKLTNTISDLAKISITRSSTQASNKDAENFVTKQRLW